MEEFDQKDLSEQKNNQALLKDMFGERNQLHENLDVHAFIRTARAQKDSETT
ncbi:hypothetical protein AB4254_07960 [Vibrio breoganii]